jgi:tetratricopeptide (TPR) repeat protein
MKPGNSGGAMVDREKRHGCAVRVHLCTGLFFCAIPLLFSACSRNDPTHSGDGSVPAAQTKPTGSGVVFTHADGRELTLNDLKRAEGQPRSETIVPKEVPREAEELHGLARQAGGKDEFDKAIELLERAHKLAPAWPYPVYDAAYTYLLKGDTAAAEAKYAEVDRMAPRGFFTAKASLDCLRREREARVPAGFCKEFVTLESLQNTNQKRAVLRGMIEKLPEFPPGWKEILPFLEGDESRLKAIGMGLAHDPDDDTKGVLLVHKATILYRRGDRPEAIRILGELALDPKSTLAAEQLARVTLASLVGGPGASAGKK